jgi:thiol-disulfide isomerase/thioredoxin
VVTIERRTLTVIFVLVIASFAVYRFSSGSSPEVEEGITKGKQAVNINVEGLNNMQFNLWEHRGEVVIVEFMTLWCPTCDKQIEEFKRVLEDVDITIASINVDANLLPTDEWAAKERIDWFVGHSPEAGFTYGVLKVPTVIVVDKQGIIRYRGGPKSASELVLLVERYQ